MPKKNVWFDYVTCEEFEMPVLLPVRDNSEHEKGADAQRPREHERQMKDIEQHV
jgi:hypothetical protein